MAADERATGLILRTRLLTETSVIVHWLTREAGRVATVAQGARRPKSPLRGKLDLFYIAEFAFRRSRRSELHNLRELRVLSVCRSVRTDLGKLRQGAYAAALVERTTETDTPLDGLFDLFTDLLHALESQAWKAWTVLLFENKLLHLLGLAPNLAESSLSPGSRAVYQRMAASAWADLAPLQISQAQFLELNRFLHQFLQFQFHHLPTSRAAALKNAD